MDLSYVSGISDAPLSGETIGRMLERRVGLSGDRLALVSRHQAIRLTWSELADRARAVAKGLIALGVEPGDRVGIWAPARSEWTELQLGSAMVGAILVNINPAYLAGELSYALSKVEVRFLGAVAGFRGADYFAMVKEVRGACPSLERVIAIGTEGPVVGGVDSDLTWRELLEAGEGVDPGELEAREQRCDPDDPINIQFTSGTTGRPKGATLTHHNVVNTGGIIVYPGEAFDPVATLEALAEERCTSIYGVPTMFIAMLGHPRFAEFDLRSLRTGIMAGAPCPIEIMKRVVDEMHASAMTIAYGMTETAPGSTLTRIDVPLQVPVSTVGSALPHTEIKIADATTGTAVARGERGEIWARGYL